MKKKRAYKIEVLGEQFNPVIVLKMSEIETAIECFVDTCDDDSFDDDIGSVYTITPIMMTEKEIEELPEWEGT